ncbi:MAG: hypothetical protein ACP5JJ_01650 [Anaerolineae bacterium]
MNAEMPLDENDKRQLVLKLLGQLRCLACGQPYERQNFTLLHRWDDVWLLSSYCRHCDETSHVIILMRLDADPVPTTDLTPDEMGKAEDWSPITADDVLEIHALLDEFEGDFEEFFTL